MSVHRHANSRVVGYLVLAAICVVVATSPSAWANGTGTPATSVAPEEMAPVQPSQPAQIGAGCLTSARASNVATNAWIYTGQDWVTATPEATTGTAQAFACAAPSTAAAGATPPTADVVTSFVYPAGGSRYDVKFTCILQNQMGFEGVSVLKPIFGGTSTRLMGMSLPGTLAYIAVLGNATISKDGTTIAENQPAIFLVTQAIHDPMHRLLTEGDPTRREIHLVVPGSLLQGGSAVAGFPAGGFYIYWPDAAVDIQNLGGRVQLSQLPAGTAPSGLARGPVRGAAAMPFRITITDTGIQRSSALLPEGLYAVTITNRASKTRGVHMTGTDICCTEFSRFSKMLKPGQSETFRFVFAQGRVDFRDMTKCERRARTCAIATYGSHSTTVTFR